MKIKCLVVDDEPSAQIVLKKFIKEIDFLELSGISNNAIEALEMIKNEDVDLLFLDINMPKISGLTFYKSLQNPPYVIFTTAYPKYAVDGFEVSAIDFLLKPFSFERFLTAINKVVEKKSLNQIKNRDENDFLLIKSNKTLHKICIDSIIFIEACGDYVKLNLNDKFVLTNNTFSNIFDMLPKHKFVQCHKSFAINLVKIDSISGNQISIINHKVPIGQKFKSDFLNSLNKGN